MTERAHAVSLNAKALDAMRNFPITAKAPPSGELANAVSLRGFSLVHTSFTSLLLSVLGGLWYTMVNMGHHGNIETDRM